MPSQKHHIYLLPRADPDELQEGAALPCFSPYPLQLRIRIPPSPPLASASSEVQQAASTHSVRDQSSALSASSSLSSSLQSRSPVLPTPLSLSISSSSRASKTQIATWKLLAPQIKTLSSSSNTYLLSETFPGITSASLQQFPVGKDGQWREGERTGSDYSLSSTVQGLKLDPASLLPARPRSPTRTASVSTDAAPSSTSPALPSNTSPCATSTIAPASPSAGALSPSTSLSTIQESFQSEDARLTRTGSIASSAIRLRPNATTRPLMPMQRPFSSSTISSVQSVSHTSSLNGSRKVPAVYRKELESVLFAQTASASSASTRNSIRAGGYSIIPTRTSGIFSVNSADELRNPHSNDTFPSSSFSRSLSTTTSSASSMNNASASSIPFLDDKTTFTGKPKSEHRNPDDAFQIDGDNSNVVHVDDLGWYLEKVLWKLGLHRKGRKEFLAYWLPRFAKDSYVALRFLKQDEIEAFAPVEISLVSSTTSTSATSTGSTSPASLPTFPISGFSSPRRDWRRPPIERRNSSEYSVISSITPSATAQEMDDRNTCSSLSSSSLSNSSNTFSGPGTPSSEAEQFFSTALLPIPRENPYSLHRIHVLFLRLDQQDLPFFKYTIKYKSGSSTLGVIDWSDIYDIVPSEESKRQDRPRVLHVSATDLGRRGLYFN